MKCTPALDIDRKALVRHGERWPKRRPLRRKGTKRCRRPVPGDRVQVGVCKIGPVLYQHAAIDDGGRFQVLGRYPRQTAAATLAFLEQVLEEAPFAGQRPDRPRPGARRLRAPRAAARVADQVPADPSRSPYLNGPRPAHADRCPAPGSTASRSVVKRAQRTALEEFWPEADGSVRAGGGVWLKRWV